MKVCLVASEALPFVKVGGLADVSYSLSKALVQKKVKTSIIIPYYRQLFDSKKYDIQLFKKDTLNMNWRRVEYSIYQTEVEHITYYLIDCPYYFARDEVYAYFDDLERFCFFNLASSKLLFESNLRFDVVHVNDWETSMIPLIYKDKYLNSKKKKVSFMLTIHNPAFQGIMGREDLYDLLNLDTKYFDEGLCRLDNNVNFLKTAIELCDVVTTVSNNHKNELLRGQFSYGLERILPSKKTDFVGITNGLDTVNFNPKTDKIIKYNYDSSNVFKMKYLNKVELCKELGLEHPEWPLISFVGRLSYQKGINYIIQEIDKFLKFDINFVILGKGDKELENQLTFLSMHYPNLNVQIAFSDHLANELYASSDYLLMPSVFEPCGISQLIALRYGTLPIASSVGGLRDTVISYDHFNEEYADGILFSLDTDSPITHAIFRALDIESKKKIKHQLIRNAMKQNFSWLKASEEYIRLYQQIINKNNY